MLDLSLIQSIKIETKISKSNSIFFRKLLVRCCSMMIDLIRIRVGSLRIQHSNTITDSAHFNFPQILKESITLSTLFIFKTNILSEQSITFTLAAKSFHINKLFNWNFIGIILLDTKLAEKSIFRHKKQFFRIVDNFLLITRMFL